jgi:predicted dehydrogenase
MKVLIVGLGSIGKKHVAILLAIQPDIKIVALRSSTNAENVSQVENIYHLAEVELCDFDFAIVSNPTSEHKKTIQQLIEFHIPLFIEKPLYSSLDINEVIDTINQLNIFTYIACNLRFLDCILYVKEQLSSSIDKRINEVNVYCGSYLPEWRPNTNFRQSYSAILELGGGVHIDLIHELDYIYWLFGKPKTIKRNFRTKSSLAIQAYDYANYLLDYDGFCTNIVLNYFRRDPKRNLEIVFEDETWIIDLLKNQITCRNQIIYSTKQHITDTYKVQMQYFINCIQNKEASINTINDAYNVLKICLDK